MYASRISTLLLTGVALLGASTHVFGQTVPPQPVTGKIAWVYTYEEGKALGRKTGKPLFVVFRCER